MAHLFSLVVVRPWHYTHHFIFHNPSLWSEISAKIPLTNTIMSHHHDIHSVKVFKNYFQMIPMSYITKKSKVTWCHQSHVKVLKKCFPMIPISYITKKGNGTWCHHSHEKVLKKCFQIIPISYVWHVTVTYVTACHKCTFTLHMLPQLV